MQVKLYKEWSWIWDRTSSSSPMIRSSCSIFCRDYACIKNYCRRKFRHPEWFYYFECTIITDIVTRENRFTRSDLCKFELHFCTFADDSKQNVKCLVHFVEIQWTMITTCICIKRYAEESFTIAVAFIYSYRISLFHPIRIVSDSEPNEIKLNKWISRNRSPAIFISNEAIQSRSRCYVNTVAWITVEHSHYPNTY